MPDIRKMLEKQLELLQDHSNVVYENNPAELTFAMLAIIDTLYPNGIPSENNEDPAHHVHKVAGPTFSTVSERLQNDGVIDDNKHLHRLVKGPVCTICIDSKEVATTVADLMKNQISSATLTNGELNIQTK